MLSGPPRVWIADNVGRNSCHIFPVRPIRPALSEIARVSKHVCSVCFVRERVLAVRVLEGAVVVIRVRKHHNVAGSTLAQKQVIDDLSRAHLGFCRSSCPEHSTYPSGRSSSAGAGIIHYDF